MAQAEELTDHDFRVLADDLHHGCRWRADLGIRGLAAPPRGDHLDPLVHLSLARVPPVRSGLIGLFSQNLILMGVFFVIPLYLQLVLGLNALETGIKMLPVSITMFVTSAIGSRLSNRFPVRTIVRTGLIMTIAGTLILLSTIKPTLSSRASPSGWACSGSGWA